MAIGNFHLQKFDDASKVKLHIFEYYTKEWLPVYLHNSYIDNIIILDLFCGPGVDIEDNAGSPVRILDVLKTYERDIIKVCKKISLYFNDSDAEKVCALKERICISDYANCEYRIDNADFIIHQLLPEFNNKNTATLLILDPTGLQIPVDTIRTISNISNLDYILYFPASFIYRFKDNDSFVKKLPGISSVDILNPWNTIDAFRKYIHSNCTPRNKKYYVGSFGVKKENKGKSISGIIFGSNSPRGLEKFITAAWQSDPVDGSGLHALMNINTRNIKLPISFLHGMSTKKKLQFDNELKQKILARELVTNEDVFHFSLEHQFPSNYVRKIIKQMIMDGLLQNDIQKFHLTYRSIFQQKNIIPIKLHDKI